MKNQRHNLILEIVENQTIQTQDELAAALQARGVDVTQATVSRDIKELRLIKTTTANGVHAYVAVSGDETDVYMRMIRLFRDAVLSIDSAGNLIVVKTVSGSANAAAEAVDGLRDEDILGTIAGDNTILIIVRSEHSVQRVILQFRQWMEAP